MTETKSKYRIAQIVGNSVTGGVPSCILNYYRFFNRKDFVFDFYTYGPSRLDDEIKALGGNIFYMPSIINFPRALPKLTKLLKAGNYDIVHSHLTSLSVVPLFAARLAGIKHRYCHAHSTTCKGERMRNAVKNTLKKFCPPLATRLLACSSYSAEWMYGGKAKNAVIIRNAIDTERFCKDNNQRESIRREWGANDKVIGHIGRFEYQKNHDFLLDVFAEVLKKRPDSKLILVGQGSLESDIKIKIDKLGIKEKVIFMPEIYSVEKYYNGFDVLLLPSRYEGLPLVGVEAQAVGLPCIFSEFVTGETNITGNNLFLPIDDPVLWADAALRILESPLSTKSFLIKEKGYDIREAAKELEELYRKDL